MHMLNTTSTSALHSCPAVSLHGFHCFHLSSSSKDLSCITQCLPTRIKLCLCCQQLQNDLYSVNRHIWSPVCTCNCTVDSYSIPLQARKRCYPALKSSVNPVKPHQCIMHLSLGCGTHVEAGQLCKQLSLTNIQVSGHHSGAATPGTGKGKKGREADENCWERGSGVSWCFKEAVACQGIGRSLLLLALEHGPRHGWTALAYQPRRGQAFPVPS